MGQGSCNILKTYIDHLPALLGCGDDPSDGWYAFEGHFTQDRRYSGPDKMKKPVEQEIYSRQHVRATTLSREDRHMKKAQLLYNAISTGHLARDYLRDVQQIRNPSTTDTPPKGQGAQAVLESYYEHHKSLPDDPPPPVKGLVTVLTEGLRDTSGPASENGAILSERLFKGCPVRLRGVPERRFIVVYIYWDIQEVRIGEPVTGMEYVVPWDCLRFIEKRDR
jgi:hypothetical protein